MLEEPSPSTEISTSGQTVVAFVGNAKYLVGGGKLMGVQVRRVADGQRTASLTVEGVLCLGGSEDGRWIAAGTDRGEVSVWSAETYQRIFKDEEPGAVKSVDFFANSTRLVSTTNQTVTTWDIPSGKRLQTLDHEAGVVGDFEPVDVRLSAATENSVRAYDGYDGRLLAEIPVRAVSSNLPWFRNRHIFAISDSTIKELDAISGSIVAVWSVPYSEHPCIALPLHEEFIAHAAQHGITFWDTSTHIMCGSITRPLEISSVTFSPEGTLLAICGLDGEVTIQDLKDGFPSSCLTAPCIHIAEDTLDSGDAKQPLTDTTSISHHQSDHLVTSTPLVRVLTKRSKLYVADGRWERALEDANKVIELDPSSPWGYERKHAALHNAGDYENAASAFEAMLSKISQSSDPDIRGKGIGMMLKAVIRRAVQDAIRDSPPALINSTSGRLLDKSEQAASFESHPVFKKLISSMTTIIDHTRIEHDVKEYYRYAMLSHKREDDEPSFDKVVRVIVYDLEDSPTNNKLKMFCKIVRDTGLQWAWSDSCCIDRGDDSVLQEALVAMFRWYHDSAVTLILLRDVLSPSECGDLVRSIWNTRAWTFQEYHASKVVRFYNGDWTLYRDIDVPNHKESPEILSEMEEATGITAEGLAALQPGSDNIRRKLYLVSRRETGLVEDEAYSLLGTFSEVLPIIYGDGDKALGRLLAQMLTSSGDASILAWTGKSGSFNSCLPGRICAFNQLPTLYISPSLTGTEMKAITATLRASPLDLDLVMNLYDRLRELPLPSFLGQRIKLPCLAFQLGPLSVSRTRSEQVFRAHTTMLGIVEIGTAEDLSQSGTLILVNPWISLLLSGQSVGEPSFKEKMRDQPSSASEEMGDQSSSTSEPSSPSSPIDNHTIALQLIAHLKQPFGALLLTPAGRDEAEYRRVAPDSLITVRIQDTPLDDLIDSVQILDVL